MNDLMKRIRKVMGSVFDIDPAEIAEDAGPGVVENWDSLQHMTLILALEEEFAVRIPDEMIEQMLNVKLIESILDEIVETKTVCAE